ncbi:MAG: aminodeoxychorismate lyase, protein [Patescibacteria group bacterium]|nr:aminodeoxychorismate lyase, protein [Patescibacteria group bacterium]
MEVPDITNYEGSAPPPAKGEAGRGFENTNPLLTLPLAGEGTGQPKSRKRRFAFFGLVAGLAAIVVISFGIAGRPPSDFVPETVVVIPGNASTKSAGDILVKNHIIRSSSIFQAIIQTILGDRPVIAGQFQFDKPVSVLKAAQIVTGGSFGRTQIKLTIPEGSSNADISKIVLKQIPDFNEKTFLKNSGPFQGNLFPETYLVFKTITPDELIARMRQEFDKKISALKSDISASRHDQEDLVNMAAILEKEAKNSSDAARIAGILWHRIAIGMPLQVDAAPVTYKEKGFPKVPIGNPGVAMINAAIHPVSSDYLYYLYDKKGVIHYAKTYAGHQANIEKYLR